MAKSRKRQQWVPPKEEALQSPTFGPSELIGLLTGTALINRVISGTKSVLKTSAIRLKQLPSKDTAKSWYRYHDIPHKGKPATKSLGGSPSRPPFNNKKGSPVWRTPEITKMRIEAIQKLGGKKPPKMGVPPVKDHSTKTYSNVKFWKSFKDLLTPEQRALASKAQQERKKLDSNRSPFEFLHEMAPFRRVDKTPDAVTRSLRKRLYTDTTKTQKEMLKKGYEEHLGGRTLQPKLPKLPSARDTTIVPKKAAEKAKREHEINERRGYGGGLWQRYADEPRSPKDIIDTDWWKDF